MSIEGKVSSAVREVFMRIDDRIKDLRAVKADVNLLMTKVREELDRKTQELSIRETNVSKAETAQRQRLQRQLSDYIQQKENEQRKFESDLDELREIAQTSVKVEIERFRGLLPVNDKLTEAYINALFYADDRVVELMRNKRLPNLNAADTISGYKKELRELRLRLMDLEYEADESIFNEADENLQEFEQADEDEDTVKYFVSKEEYDNLSVSERNQLALDKFLARTFSKRYIGLMYEREVGYIYETLGYDVTYRGVELGKLDGGIDLVCKKPGETIFVQCKNWSGTKIIHENYICQLYGATHYYSDNILAHKEILPSEPSLFDTKLFEDVKAVFVTTTRLDEHALAVAKYLDIEVKEIPFTRDYPMIKCNINNAGEKIYHLPFDQMYDKVKINKLGEFNAWTVKEAEDAGFRRAFRWHGDRQE